MGRKVIIFFDKLFDRIVILASLLFFLICIYAMYDAFTEYGGEWKITFRNSAAAPEAFRQVCRDAVADTPGLEIAFE